MKLTTFGVAVILMLTCASVGPIEAQTGQALPVPGHEAVWDVPGAHQLPDPNTEYKVVFSVAQGAQDPTDVNPMLPVIARYLNTLAKYGVPSEHRHLVVMFHQRTADFDIVMTNDAYRDRYEGQDNPNVALIRKLTEAGVEFRVCGQGLIAREIDAAQVNPDIQVDLWAMTSMIDLQLDGYVKIP
ncbi:MAG: DsrE family protein [Vicinamibacterales bacterium]|jgi:intracellular sulfur oxidation DsrE/DsrF family protein|nr:hypothetical protein [Acidobacteriota bacterium]MDP6373190.1 DsrE family protein [Vicinamibacterales bacterium]MDP6607496.1 DsrE family protein [Vicinamibacterales bacterium]HAK56307.1 hypothetical protein [Acidobacteriota bacterium]|tara:strand:+ start:4038 stop:4592 length:555 start_codon:yes stop_codon:yes gene_type:complete